MTKKPTGLALGQVLRARADGTPGSWGVAATFGGSALDPGRLSTKVKFEDTGEIRQLSLRELQLKEVSYEIFQTPESLHHQYLLRRRVK